MPAESGSVEGQPSCECRGESRGTASACRSVRAAQAVLPWYRGGGGGVRVVGEYGGRYGERVSMAGSGQLWSSYYCVVAAMASRVVR
jgi:hypothetical protein